MLRRRAEGMRVIAEVFQVRPRGCRSGPLSWASVSPPCCTAARSACALSPRSSRHALGFAGLWLIWTWCARVRRAAPLPGGHACHC